jgi:4,5-dihydroxyphthalate decarboxylase
VALADIRLSIATTDYDHFRDFRLGAVRAEGIEHTWSVLGHHEVFARFTAHREWDVAELSIAKFAAQVTRDEPDIIGLPVVCSRVFRFGAFYVNRKSGIRTAEDLRGRRVGSPEWAHSAAVYMRGWLHDEAGVKLDEVDWVQAGANAPGRVEKVELSLPAGVRLTRVPDRSLSDLLAAGDLDCAIIARPPDCFLRGHPDVHRLFPDFQERELDAYQKNGVWPIMHIIAMRRAILDRDPWVARNLYNAFEASKRRSVERLLDPAVSRYPLPWLPAYAARMRDLFGGDPFPYGLEANRATVAQLLSYAHQQGIAHRLATPDEVFPPGIDTRVIV